MSAKEENKTQCRNIRCKEYKKHNDGEKFLSLEVGVVNISDVVAGVLLPLAADEVVVSPEEDVSWGVPSVRVCPLGDDEGVDVVTSVMVVL